MEIKENDLFYTSWGYDQTNYDYILVVGLSQTKKTAFCKMAKYEEVGHTGQANIQKPITIGYGKTFKMRIYSKSKYFGNNEDNGEVLLRGSYPFCDDAKRLDTFYKVGSDDTFYETDTSFGH